MTMTTMDEARRRLHALSRDLTPDAAGRARLHERVAGLDPDESMALRAVLQDLGAAALLDDIGAA